MPVPLRTDFDAAALRAIARTTKDGPQARRLLALAAIYDGATRTAAARIGGVTVQIVRDWVVKFNAHGPEGLINRETIRNFVCGSGMMGGKEPNHAETQRASYT